jgi:Zn-dependent protease
MNIKVADYFGIPLFFNLLIFPFVYFIYLTREDLSILAVALFCLMLFFVLLHEYGHCWAARKLGWDVESITLLPIGGIAKIYFKHLNPKHEIFVALAGPAVSLILSVLCFGGIIIGIFVENPNLAFMFIVLFINNSVILVFNMLPLFPSDGGRVFRAALSMMLGHVRGTWWAVRLSQTLAVGLSLTAIYYGYFLAAFLLLFLVVIAQNELAFSKLLVAYWKMREDVAEDLNKPELREANLPEIIAAIEAVEDPDLKEKISKEELMPLLRDLQQTNIGL